MKEPRKARKRRKESAGAATRHVRVVPAPGQLPTRTPNQYQTALTQVNRADGWRREGDVSLIRAGRAAMS